MVSLVDELTLLAFDDYTGRNRAPHLELGLGGAILLELTLAERIDVEGGRIRVLDPSPIGERFCDGALRTLATEKPRKPAAVVQRTGRGLKRPVCDDLVARGVLRHQRERALGIFPFSRHLPNQPSVEADARARLNAALDRGAAVDARTAALASLVYAVQLGRVVFPDRRQRDVRKTLKAIAEGSWAGEATRKAVEAAQAAVSAAILASTAASAGGAAGGT